MSSLASVDSSKSPRGSDFFLDREWSLGSLGQTQQESKLIMTTATQQ